jgi:ABC-type polysaccharide/polyol phosphate transport system ATPase subunit
VGAPRVEFRGVGKTFRRRNRSDALRDAIPRLFAALAGGNAKGGDDRFVALDGVTFHLDEGEVLGLVGANGAGKSTALRLAADIYKPDAGEVTVRGRVSALIELSAGFHPDLTGRENVYLVGALLGLRRREVDAVMDSIVTFADIGDFLESPVRTYSTGMAVRLGFAVAAFVPAEVLLVDEVLAVGDIDFQAKCLRRMAERREEGVAVLFVSHNLQVVEQFCDRVIFLHHGKIEAEGRPREVLATFRRFLADEKSLGLVRESATPRLRRGTGEVRIGDVRRNGVPWEQDATIEHGGNLRITARWKAARPMENVKLQVQVHAIHGFLCEESTRVAERMEGEGELAVEFEALRLLPGYYEVSVAALGPDGLLLYDFHQRLYSLHVTGNGKDLEGGVVALHPKWDLGGAP